MSGSLAYITGKECAAKRRRNIKISKFFSEDYHFPNQSINLLQKYYLSIYMQ